MHCISLPDGSNFLVPWTLIPWFRSSPSFQSCNADLRRDTENLQDGLETVIGSIGLMGPEPNPHRLSRRKFAFAGFLHDLTFIFSKRRKFCVDPLKPPAISPGVGYFSVAGESEHLPVLRVRSKAAVSNHHDFPNLRPFLASSSPIWGMLQIDIFPTVAIAITEG